MEPLLDLPIDQFFGALDELRLDPERRADLLREYRRRNSAFSPVYGLLDSVADEDAAAGMQRADIVPISRPEGMSVFEAIRSGDWRLAVPQGALDAVGNVAGALDVPAAAAAGLIPREDMVGEALNAAGTVMGLGGLLARPAGSFGMGGRIADDGFSEYLSRVNPGQRRIPAENRPNLGMGDMYGMLPRNARKVGERDGVQFYEADGDFYATAYNPDVQEMDVVGYAINAGDGTDLQVVSEMQGSGIGGELQYLYRRANPDAPTGGLTEAGERSLRRTYDRLRDEGVVSANRSTTAGLLASAASDTPAQQVARLLREDPSQVTDDMLNALTPNDNVELARLYDEGATGMPMPMDEASRMSRAREMGFDTDAPLYHGTNFDFRNFFQNPEVRRFDNRASRRGTWFSTNPDDAEFYGETIYPVFVSGRYQNLPSMEEMGADVVDRLMSIRPQNIETDLAAEEFVDFLRSAKPPGFYTDVAGTRMSQAQRQGFDGVRLIGGETVQQISEPGDNVAVFDPRNIRSRFARFDPRLSHLRNLNAANIDPLTGAAAMGASQPTQDPLASLRAYLAQNGLLSQ